MADAVVFEWLTHELEKRTSLTRNEARGTVRLVLKDAGLDPATVRARQMMVVVERLLAGQLKKRGIARADALCAALGSELAAGGLEASEPDADTPYDVFERLGTRRNT
jgi:hypothetical protein